MEGIENYLLDDARTLIEKDTPFSRSHAVALIVLAIEEMGKAKVLFERLQLCEKEGGARARANSKRLRKLIAETKKALRKI